MKSYHIIFTILGLGLLLSACEAIVDEPFPEHESKLVLNGYLEPNKAIEVYLSRSYGLLEQIDSVQQIMIENATVELLTDGQFVSTMTYRDTLLDPFGAGFAFEKIGKYTAEGIVGESGKTYTVRASSEGFNPIEASTTLPAPVTIVSAEIDQNVARPQDPFQGNSASQSFLKVTIDDPAGIKNYYNFEATIWYFDTTAQQEIPAFIYVQGLAKPADNGGFTADETIISDADFDGETITLDLLVELPNAYDEQVSEIDIRSIVLETTSANEDYAQFKIKEEQQAFSGGFDLFPSESVQVYDNVQNGFGILGGFVVSRDSVIQ